MGHYSDKKQWEFSEEIVDKITVIRLTVTEWSCKEH